MNLYCCEPLCDINLYCVVNPLYCVDVNLLYTCIVVVNFYLFMWQMDMSNKEQEYKEFEFGMFVFAWDMSSSSERLSYAPRRLSIMTGLQWVEEKEQNPKVFYSMFRMRRSVFHPLHDLLVEKYGLEETCNIASKESLALFYGLWVQDRPLIMLQIGLYIAVLSLTKSFMSF